MANGIIVMTALPPTLGHAYLIEFASQFIQSLDPNGYVHVVVCSRSFEPIPGQARAAALIDRFRSSKNIWIHHRLSSDPQYPADHPDFWPFWKSVVVSKVNKIQPDDILFASDSYGIEFARALGCRFVPCDPQRKVIKTQATQVRLDPIGNFDDILPEFSEGLRKTVTFFGSESTGKTELSRQMSWRMNGHWCHEWARSYLELCGPEVTDARMTDIVHGQFAAQRAVAGMPGKPFVFQDTDLLSTLGYYRIYGGAEHPGLREMIARTPSDLYIVMNSGIPFTPDKLRYGGHQRESTDDYWIRLLEEFGRPYFRVTETEAYAQIAEVSATLHQLFHQQTDWSWFHREAA